jgi:hypothetical protein
MGRWYAGLIVASAADLAGGGEWDRCRRQEAPWSYVGAPAGRRRSLWRRSTHILTLKNHPRGIKYRAFVDPSGGRVDAACLCIAHRESELVVVDVLRGVRAPHDPAVVAADFATLAKSYGVHEIVGDRYSGAWVEQAFSKVGVRYTVADLVKSEIYLECVGHFAQGKVRLPHHDALIRELRLLERRTGRSGKDAVDHPRHGSDDFANAACGVIDLCLRVQPGFMRVGAIDFVKTGRVFWHPEQRERPRVRIVTITEKEDLRQRGLL